MGDRTGGLVPGSAIRDAPLMTFLHHTLAGLGLTLIETREVDGPSLSTDRIRRMVGPVVRSLHSIVKQTDTQLHDKQTTVRWASDASRRPAVADRLSDSITTIAIAGPVRFAARLDLQHASIKDGEAAALLTAMVADTVYRSVKAPIATRSVIIVDHKALVRRPSTRELQRMPARNFIRGIEMIRDAVPRIQVVHQKAHTNGTTVEAILNDIADNLAKEAHKSQTTIAITGIEDKWALRWKGKPVALYDEGQMVQGLNVQKRRREGPKTRQEWESAYPTSWANQPWRWLAKTQTYVTVWTLVQARARQLPTKARLKRRGLDHGGDCQCGTRAEDADEHHVFVSCTKHDQERVTTLRMLDRIVEKIIRNEDHRQKVKRWVSGIVTDGDQWRNGQCEYWIGVVPELEHALNRDIDVSTKNYLFSEIILKVLWMMARIWSTR